MDFGLLGPLAVWRDGRELSLGGPKRRALLCLLLLRANEVVATTTLVDELWDGPPPATAVKAIQVRVSQLRKVLGDGVLLTKSPGYVLVVEPRALDLSRFESLLAEARKADEQQASELLREALELWRGPALVEFATEPFAEVEGARLNDLRLVALEERIEADLALGRHRDVIGELETAVAAYPYRERLRGQLMVALYRSGRQVDALAAFRSARDTLDELGIAPSAELRLLEKAVLVQDLTLGVRSLPVNERARLPGPLVPAPSFAFVGREGELAVLRSQVKRAAEGQGAVALVASQAGGGKTRFVREVAVEAAAGGVLVLYGTSSATITVPFQTVREWLEFVIRVCDTETLGECLGDSGGQLSRLVPEFGRLESTSVQPPGVAVTDAYVLQRAVTEFLERLSRVHPLLLVADDLHWADRGTLQLVGRLSRIAPGARMVVVGAFRDRGEEVSADLSGTLADLTRLEGVTRLALGNLTNDEVGALISASTDAVATSELVSTIGDLTSGTPLLVCELWRDLLASGDIDVLHSQVRLARPLSGVRGSERINEVVRHRLSRLSDEAGRMLELAAVAGPRFELRLLFEVAGLDWPALVASIEEAVAAGMLEEMPDLEPACRFPHELVRRAIYDQIRRIRRPELHLRVGEALERTYAADLGAFLPELAHHLTLAAPLVGGERGIDYNLRAAEAATATSAYDEAAARLSSALELGISDPRQRAHVQAELGLLLYYTGRVGESEEILTASLDAATSLEERGLAVRALVHRTAERLHSDPDVGSAEIVPVAEDAIRSLEQLNDPLGLAAAENLLGNALSREGRTREAFAAYDRALGHAEIAGDHVTRRDVIGNSAVWLCQGATPVGEAISRLAQLRRSTQADLVLDAGLRRCQALVFAMAGRFDEAREDIEASDLLLDQSDQSTLSLSSRWLAAEAKVLAGDAAGARQDVLAAFLSMRNQRGAGSEARALRAAADLALLCCDEGSWDEAAEYLSYGRHVDLSSPPKGKVFSIFRLAARGRLAAHRGDYGQALELTSRAVELAGQTDWLNYQARACLALAEVQLANDRNVEATAAVATAYRLYEEKGNVAAIARLRTEGR